MATARKTTKEDSAATPIDPIAVDSTDEAVKEIADSGGVNTPAEAIEVANAAAQADAQTPDRIANAAITQPGGVPTGVPQSVADAARDLRAAALKASRAPKKKRVETYKAFGAAGQVVEVERDLDSGARKIVGAEK